MEKLSPDATRDFRTAQKKRSRVILALILIWIAAIYGLTMVKGQLAVAQRGDQFRVQHGSE